MNIKFTIDNSEDYYTVTKSDHYGYNLTKYTKAKSKDAKKPYSQHTLFYANLQQVSDRIIWLGLQGNNIQELVDSMIALSERLGDALGKV